MSIRLSGKGLLWSQSLWGRAESVEHGHCVRRQTCLVFHLRSERRFEAAEIRVDPEIRLRIASAFHLQVDRHLKY